MRWSHDVDVEILSVFCLYVSYVFQNQEFSMKKIWRVKENLCSVTGRY